MSPSGTTEKQAWKRIDKLERQAWLGASPFPDDTPAAQAIRLVRGWLDTGYWFQTYLPHYFTQPPAGFHEALIALCDTKKFAAVAAPRGHAKSTVITFGHSLQELSFRRFWYEQIISTTKDAADEFVCGIRDELEDNDRIRRDFGNLVGNDTWTDNQIITASCPVDVPDVTAEAVREALTDDDLAALGIVIAGDVAEGVIRILLEDVAPRLAEKGTRQIRGFGRGQKNIRGRRHGPHRPDRIKCDDIEDDEQAANQETTDKVIRWFTGSVMPGREPKTGRIFVIGTILSTYTLLTELLREDRFKRFAKERIAAIFEDETGEERALWPERWSLAELAEEREDLGEEEFAKEYLSEAPDEAGKPFPTSLEDYVRFKVEELDGRFLDTKLWCDPALGRTRKADTSAIVLTHWDDKAEVLFVRVGEVKVRRPEDCCRRMIEVQRDYGLINDGEPARYEDVGFQELMQNLHERIAHEMGIRGALATGFPVPDGDKDTRIKSTGHPVHRGRIRFIDSPEIKPLLRQYSRQPKGKKDGPDLVATAYKHHVRSTSWKPAYRGRPRAMQFRPGAF